MACRAFTTLRTILFLLTRNHDRLVADAIMNDDADVVRRHAARCCEPATHFVKALIHGSNACARELARVMPTNGQRDELLVLNLGLVPENLISVAVPLIDAANGFSQETVRALLTGHRSKAYAAAFADSGIVPPDFAVSDGVSLSQLIERDETTHDLKAALEYGHATAASACARKLTEPLTVVCRPVGMAPLAALMASPHLTIVIDPTAPQDASFTEFGDEHMPALRRLLAANPALRIRQPLMIAAIARLAAHGRDPEIWQLLAERADIDHAGTSAIIAGMARRPEGLAELRWLAESTTLAEFVTPAAAYAASREQGPYNPPFGRYLLFLLDMIELSVPRSDYARRYRTMVAAPYGIAVP